ncbi:MAG: hypothetical protein GY801_52515 [bacterium]|nr:hypothetical protein [bacterium]
MSSFRPLAFKNLIGRVFYEYKRYGKIFGIPEKYFFTGFPGENLSVSYMGKTASTPFGAAAGPHTQLAQNLVISWLTGARTLELRTVQASPPGQSSRPSIDSANLGFNVECSQELSLEDALREYAKAWMLIEMIKQSELLGEEFSHHYCDTVFDLSIGYDLKNIKSPRMQQNIRSLQDAHEIIRELQDEIPEEYAEFKDLNYPTNIIQSVTLSTFRGCSAEEIDLIITHLLTEYHLNVILKLNPTLLGEDEIIYILNDVLGYEDLQVDRKTFAQSLDLPEAITLLKALSHISSSCKKSLGLRLTNTLLVKNHKNYLPGETMYLSGPPLHVLGLRLLGNLREALGDTYSRIPISFSGGVDAENFADVMSLNLTPVLACTDLLKYPGQIKAQSYLKNLGEELQQVEAINIPDYIMKRFGHETEAINDVFIRLRDEVNHLGQDLPEATRQATITSQLDIFANLHHRVMRALKENDDSLELLTTDALIITNTLKSYNQTFGKSFLIPYTFKELYRNILLVSADHNLDTLLEQVMRDPRYSASRNQALPEKLPSRLSFYDCSSCGHCVAVCPNNANFVYHASTLELEYANYQWADNDFKEVPGGRFLLEKTYQVANFTDVCNECGVCGIHCSEQGRPFYDKPRYFGSQDAWRAETGQDGFCVEQEWPEKSICGRIDGQEYRLWHDTRSNKLIFIDGFVEAMFGYPDVIENMQPLTSEAEGHILDMRIYYILITQLQGVLDDENANYVNIEFLDT